MIVELNNDNFDENEDTTSKSARTELRQPKKRTNTEATFDTRITTDQIVDTVLRRLR